MLISLLGVADKTGQLLQGLGVKTFVGGQYQKHQEEQYMVRFGNV